LGEAECGVEFYGCVEVSDPHGEVVESASFDLLVCSGHVLLLVWFVVLGCGGGIRGLGVARAPHTWGRGLLFCLSQAVIRGQDVGLHDVDELLHLDVFIRLCRSFSPYSFLHFAFGKGLW